jgi:hypothetical protein
MEIGESALNQTGIGAIPAAAAFDADLGCFHAWRFCVDPPEFDFLFPHRSPSITGLLNVPGCQFESLLLQTTRHGGWKGLLFYE